jgi:hypothetical protein
MAGPNGRGKSCVFDAFQAWQGYGTGRPFSLDPSYHLKDGQGDSIGPQRVHLEFHEALPSAGDLLSRVFYVRSAYRNQADFTSEGIRVHQPVWKTVLPKLIDNEARVSQNYDRLVAASVADLYDGEHDTETVGSLRASYLEPLAQAMTRLFGDLALYGPGDPLLDGTFLFDKGSSRRFRYKNLSGGEKAVFDLLLDMVVAGMDFKDSVFCIDEPELHLNTRVQGQLLNELLDLLPVDSQLWIATGSLGIFSRAKDLARHDPSRIAVLDFERVDGDNETTISPVTIDRVFWRNTLRVAIDDLAMLVAPAEMVICEGSPARPTDGDDAACYRTIFSQEFPDADFMSVGNANDAIDRSGRTSAMIRAVAPGTSVVRLIDRDERSATEIADLRQRGVRVLSERHLESYLFADEILTALCESCGKPERARELLDAKAKALAESRGRGNATNDMKSAAGETYNAIKRVLDPPSPGSSYRVFMREVLASQVTPATNTYRLLRQDVFPTGRTP